MTTGVTHTLSVSKLVVVGVIGVSFVTASPAQAQHHKARLSADLEDHLAAGSQSIDLIAHGDKAAVDALAARYNLVVKRYMKSGAVLTMNAGQLDAVSHDDSVDHLSGDVRIKASDVTTESIGADQVWEGSDDLPGLTGEGVTVAVIDSGIGLKGAMPNALKKRVLISVDFTGGDSFDYYGHGTHVAGIIAGARGATKETRIYSGVAPGAWLVNLRVLREDGSGNASDVIEAIDWAIDHRREYHIGVINLSLGAPVLQPYRDDPLCEAVERAVQAGIVVVAAAGNNGQTIDHRLILGGITAPGNDPLAITVGAIDTHGTAYRSDDTVAPYSSRGPTRYDLVLKPDVAAPGTHVVSTEAVGSYLSTTYSSRHVAGVAANAYFQLSGTSMAAPVVSGAVAVLLEERPRLTPRDAKVALQVTSSDFPNEGFVSAGAGSVNLLSAVAFVRTRTLSVTEIARERVTPSGLAFLPSTDGSLTTTGSIVWGQSKSIVWGQAIVWGQPIVWGQDSTVWGPSIVWGQDSTLWGPSIVWGQDSIVWGQDSIVWGQDVLAAGL